MDFLSNSIEPEKFGCQKSQCDVVVHVGDLRAQEKLFLKLEILFNVISHVRYAMQFPSLLSEFSGPSTRWRVAMEKEKTILQINPPIDTCLTC